MCSKIPISIVFLVISAWNNGPLGVSAGAYDSVGPQTLHLSEMAHLYTAAVKIIASSVGTTPPKVHVDFEAIFSQAKENPAAAEELFRRFHDRALGQEEDSGHGGGKRLTSDALLQLNQKTKDQNGVGFCVSDNSPFW